MFVSFFIIYLFWTVLGSASENLTPSTKSIFFRSLNLNYYHKLAWQHPMSKKKKGRRRNAGKEMILFWLLCLNSYLLVVYVLFGNCPKTSRKWTGFVNTPTDTFKKEEWKWSKRNEVWVVCISGGLWEWSLLKVK